MTLTFCPHRRACSRAGFTLIELLAVIAIIAVLAGIVIGVQAGITERQLESRAKGELATIAIALESFKAKYGDYPWLGPDTASADAGNFSVADRAAGGNSQDLYKVLAGQLIMVGDGGTSVDVRAPANQGTPLTDLGRLEAVGPTGSEYLVDPWGTPYYYYYIDEGAVGNRTSWKRPGFILLSAGPDTEFDPSAGGASLRDGELPADLSQFFSGGAANSEGAPQNLDNLIYGIEY